jgi:hypothetical protein
MTLARIAGSASVRQALLVTASTMSIMPLATKAETIASVDASIGALAASNPNFLTGSDTESGAVSLSLHPYISDKQGATTVLIDGNLNLERFFKHYGTDTSAQVGASIEHHVNERTTLSADVGYSSSDSAARHFYGGADLQGLEPGTYPDPPSLTRRWAISRGARACSTSTSASSSSSVQTAC